MAISAIGREAAWYNGDSIELRDPFVFIRLQERMAASMVEISVCHYEAFSTIPGMGNPAGVVLEGEGLSEHQMLAVASRVGFNETAFVLPSDRADMRIRYFTPGHEVNLCGHATMATLCALTEQGRIAPGRSFAVETKAGILPIRIERRSDGFLDMTMRQAEPRFVPFAGSRADLAKSIGLEESDLDDELPVVFGNTGIWTLIVPVKQLDAFPRMVPRNEWFPDILTEMPRASVHPICLQTFGSGADLHARHFSSPYSGTVEDPVTGTASGVMGAYYDAYIRPGGPLPLQLVVEQGQEIGRDGRVNVEIGEEGVSRSVRITGTAVFVKEWTLSI